MNKILILTANPKNTSQLRLDEEVREIDYGLQRAQQRDSFVLQAKWAVRTRDIQRAMLDVNPQIVHFSGHGTGDEGLVFEDETGQTKLVDGEAIAGLFKLFAEQIECVVLNGCYSQTQAEAITQHVNYVIGMKKAIADKAAIEFAVGFYDALGSGRSFEFAYELGCAAIRLAGIPEQLTPVLYKNPNVQNKKPKPGTDVTEPDKKLRFGVVLKSLLGLGASIALISFFPKPKTLPTPPIKITPSPGNNNDPSPQELDTKGLSAIEQVLNIINEERGKAGLLPLRQHRQLNEAAQAHADDMSKNNLSEHEGSDVSLLLDRLKQYDYNYRTAAHNVAVRRQSDPKGVMRYWMNNSHDRKNILNGDFSHIGIAYRKNTRRQQIYSTLVFGSEL